jgi:opacity protein-like surface antigen
MLLAAPLAAQEPSPAGIRRSTTSKLFFETTLNHSTIDVPDLSEGRESGAGIALRLGYGFTGKVAGVVDLTTASMQSDGDKYTLAQADIGVRYHFSNASRRLVPFIDAAVTVLIASQENVVLDPDDPTLAGDLDISGTGFTVGGGLLYFLGPQWALNGGFKYTRGSFDEVTFGDLSISGLSFDANSTRLNFGVSWFPMKAR